MGGRAVNVMKAGGGGLRKLATGKKDHVDACAFIELAGEHAQHI